MLLLTPVRLLQPPASLGFMLVASLVVGLAGSAHAQVDPNREVAIGLAREGRCEPALELFAGLDPAQTEDAESSRLQGECALRLQDFRRAIESLETARSLDPATPEVDLHLGMAYYHAGQLDPAAAALARAGLEGSSPEFLFYSGLVAYARDDFPAAMRRLSAASQVSEAPVEPMATFFYGRAALGAEDNEAAKVAFQKVIERHPETSWSEEAARLLAEIERGDGIPWWASAEIGFEHDANALLRGSSVVLPEGISRDSDQRGFWFVDVGATLFDLGNTSVGGMLRYGGSAHHELDQFDTHSPGATLWIDQALGVADMQLRLQYDFDAVWINEDPFVTSHLVGASLYAPWGGGMHTIVGLSGGLDEFRYDRFDVLQEGPDGPRTSGIELCDSGTADFCGPVLDEERATNRDGKGISASLLHHVSIPLEAQWLTAPWVEGEYRYHRYWSDGSEYDHHRHQVELRLGTVLPFEIGLRVSARYAYVPYDHFSVFPDPSDVAAATVIGGPARQYILSTKNRSEQETRFAISLERAIGKHVVLTTRYSRTDNYSNADVYSYDRDLFGVSLRVGLGG